ncbi:hypothetical protein CLU79DRAFT_842267 [Phycomyces nitens]|nr:hypothetical protein CLU79DRAFT_842267 [Phycomyces nitens]
MAFARYPPSQSQPYDDWGQRSKTNSTSSRSMTNSRSYSLASSASRATSTSGYDTTARTYYVELKKHLQSFLQKEALEGPSPQRVSARHKLSKLNNSQFHELAMDVYDELVRRNLDDKLVPFLAVRPDFHPKRNQARQKLATLPILRFTDLASDVYYELTRRYPQVADADDAQRPPMPPMPPLTKQQSNSTNPQPSQSTQIVPVKGMINVERSQYSDEEDSTYSPKSPGGHQEPDWPKSSGPKPIANIRKENGQDESLDMLMNDLGNMVRNSPSGQPAFESRSLDSLKQEYEDKIGGLTRRIKQLENEKESMEASSSLATEKELEQLKKADKENCIRLEALQEELEKWQDRYQHLEDARLEQQEAINRIKQETLPLLDELHRLSESNASLQIDKEQADTRVQEYVEELKQLETKYQNVRAELRSFKASSLYTTELYQQDLSKSEFLKPTKDGIILVDNVMDYQDCVHKLLQAARSSHPSGTLSVMSRLVRTCKAITNDIESAESSGRLASSEKLARLDLLKTEFSTALTNLLVASKNHVNGMGISPVSLVDVAAGQVTVVIVELTKSLGMSSSLSSLPPSTTSLGSSAPPTRAEPSPTQGYFRQESRVTSPRMETYAPQPQSYNSQQGYHTTQAFNEPSPTYPPIQPNSPRGERLLSPQELASYLKTETEHIVEAIQSLLSALRLPPHQSGQVRSIISSIVDIVTLVVVRSQNTIESAHGRPYRHRGEHVLSNLTECNETLVRIRDRFFGQTNHPSPATATAKRDLAKESYEIAKYTKELISIFEHDE